MNEFFIKFQRVLCKNIIGCDVIASTIVKDGNDAGRKVGEDNDY